MSDQVTKQLVDDAIDAYVDWHQNRAQVWDAYDRWASAEADEARRVLVQHDPAPRTCA